MPKKKESLAKDSQLLHDLTYRISLLEKECFGNRDSVKFNPVAEYHAFFGDKFVGDELLRIAGQLRYAGSQSATTELLNKLSHELYLCGNLLKTERVVQV